LAYRRALEECEKLYAAGSPKKLQAEVVLAIALGNTGRLEAAVGDPEKGMVNVKKGIEIGERAVASDPKNYLAKSELALLFWNAGIIDLGRNDQPAALSSFEKARVLQLELLEINSSDPYNLGNLAETYASIAQTMEKSGDLARARESFHKSFEIWEEMKNNGSLPGYYAGKPDLMLASLERVTAASK
jgi:tetratricopeptide (TPR) repeat protein